MIRAIGKDVVATRNPRGAVHLALGTVRLQLGSTQSIQSQVAVLGEGHHTFKSVTQGELPAYSPFFYPNFFTCEMG